MRSKPSCEIIRDAASILANFTFPYDCCSPISILEIFQVSKIASHISCELGRPEGLVGSRCRCVPTASVPMPETSMDEYGGFIFRKDKIGAPWQSRSMKSESKAPYMQFLAQSQLRARVAAANAGHHPGARCFIYYISHQSFPGNFPWII